MTEEFIKKLRKLKKDEKYDCSVNLTIDECYELYGKYKFTFEKSTYEMPHFLIEGSYLKDTIVIRKECD